MAHTVVFVNTTASIDLCLADISPFNNTQPIKLAIDLEGVRLCRYGRVSIIQIVASTSNTIWLLDVTTLGTTTFDHEDAHGQTLRGVFQNPNIKKLFFDVRNDADALWNAYQIDLVNVYDLQLLEVASRRSRGIPVRLVNGLTTCMEGYVKPPSEWKTVKEAGIALFLPRMGGSYDVFEQRPLDLRILAYCAQDIALLFRLEAAIKGRMGNKGKSWENRIVRCSASRVAEAKLSDYQTEQRAIAPKF